MLVNLTPFKQHLVEISTILDLLQPCFPDSVIYQHLDACSESLNALSQSLPPTTDVFTGAKFLESHLRELIDARSTRID